MNQTTATQITAQIAQARQTMQDMIQLGFSTETRERQERRINQLKAKLAACTA
jgi:transcription elongation GreA/GreB family factor